MLQNLKPTDTPTRVGVIVVTDRARNPEYADTTGAAVADWLRERKYSVVSTALISNDAPLLTATVTSHLFDSELILACGGTGLGPGDITPQTLEELSDFPIPGVGELLRSESLKYSRNSYLSRCGGYVKSGVLLLALSGNARATVEQLAILEDLIPNALLSIQGRCKDRRTTASS